MPRVFKALIVSLIFTGPIFAADFVTSEKYGFEMEAPTINSLNTETVQYLAMCLPAKDGFAPNVNLQIQPFAGSLQEYNDLSVRQFKDAHLKVLENQTLGSEIDMEYAGDFRGNSLHWYARAIKQDQKIFLLTATALEKSWAADSGPLLESIRSFKLTKSN